MLKLLEIEKLGNRLDLDVYEVWFGKDEDKYFRDSKLLFIDKLNKEFFMAGASMYLYDLSPIIEKEIMTIEEFTEFELKEARKAYIWNLSQ